MNYPLIKKFLPGLYITENYSEDVVYAEHLEAELAKGVEVYGIDSIDKCALYNEPDEFDKYSGLLIGYKPIESSKPVSREEIDKVMEKLNKSGDICNLLKRILENGVK